MPSLTSVLRWSATIGAESKGLDLTRVISGATQVIADTMLTLAENQSSTSPTTLWTSGNHGANMTQVSTFSFGIIIVDPDAENAQVLPLDFEIGSTRNASTTVDKHIVRADRNNPIILPSSIVGLFASETNDATDLFTLLTGSNPSGVPRITRIRARNPNPAGSTSGANNLRARLLLLG